MKNFVRKAGWCLGLSLLVFACRNADDLKVSATDSDDRYLFSADFGEEKTGRIKEVLNRHITPNHLDTKNTGKIRLLTTLPDRTQFELRVSPGQVRMELDKRTNSVSSYRRIKRIGEEIKAALVN